MWYKMNIIHLDIVCIFHDIATNFDYAGESMTTRKAGGLDFTA
jgi:hypothetical protein